MKAPPPLCVRVAYSRRPLLGSADPRREIMYARALRADAALGLRCAGPAVALVPRRPTPLPSPPSFGRRVARARSPVPRGRGVSPLRFVRLGACCACCACCGCCACRCCSAAPLPSRCAVGRFLPSPPSAAVPPSPLVCPLAPPLGGRLAATPLLTPPPPPSEGLSPAGGQRERGFRSSAPALD